MTANCSRSAGRDSSTPGEYVRSCRTLLSIALTRRGHSGNGCRHFATSSAARDRVADATDRRANALQKLSQLNEDITKAQKESSPARCFEREKPCLLWTARGKSPREFGQSLAIREYAVVFHVANAMRQLETSSEGHTFE